MASKRVLFDSASLFVTNLDKARGGGVVRLDRKLMKEGGVAAYVTCGNRDAE